MNPAKEHAPEAEREDYITCETTVLSWVNTRDHKRVGVMFLFFTTVALFLGGAFALVLRVELLTPERTIISALAYNRLFTLHGVVMIFLFMIPAIPSGFGNFVLPLMIGAKDVAFPKINLLSLYLYLGGAAIALWGMIHGGTDTGWTFYAPYSTTTPTAVVPVLVGAFILGFSSIMTGLNFIVTVHTMRAPGLKWSRMPLFVWSLYATSVIQVLATPVLSMTLALVAIEHAFGIGLFDASQGGDPVLMQHLFWFYSHPAEYILVLPAMGEISEVVCGLSR
jgi:cytochrome c oxidase subunit 1